MKITAVMAQGQVRRIIAPALRSGRQMLDGLIAILQTTMAQPAVVAVSLAKMGNHLALPLAGAVPRHRYR